VKEFGTLDGAANLAGVIPKTINIDRVEDLEYDDWAFVVDVNFTGVCADEWTGGSVIRRCISSLSG
jgi:NAD(P)-dependent dehydrogenase (short-subunit alcohol dehydrogenase family)